jgi:uncharacterized glyoxalase superfamily protein PhnB
MTTWAAIPSIRIADMAAALRFYRDVLGFEVLRGGPEDSNCSLEHGTARLMLETTADHYGESYNAAIRERLGNPSPHALYIESDDVDALHERITAAGGRVVDPIADRTWGQREFTVEDAEGNWLAFWQATSTS